MDVVALGHAIVDVLAPVPEEVVASLGLAKGTMTLVDEERSSQIFATLQGTTKASGGSAANTCAGLASFGARAAFVGKVSEDDLGREFTDDIRAAGVGYDVAPSPDGGQGTGHCLVLVTPDAERTMCTSLGIGGSIFPSDIDAGLIARARVVYLEGYLCGLPSTDSTLDAVIEEAEKAGVELALSLSDPFWVETHGDALGKVLEHCSVLFSNEAEAMGLTAAADAGAALRSLNAQVPTVVVTRGAAGCLVGSGGETFEVPADAVPQVVDTTGAGDLFAAGFLYGHVRGLGAERCAHLGGLAAGEVIGHFGARPLASLAALAGDRGLAG